MKSMALTSPFTGKRHTIWSRRRVVLASLAEAYHSFNQRLGVFGDSMEENYEED